MKKELIIATLAFLMAACGNKNKAEDPIGDSGRTLRTERLLNHLMTYGDSTVYLFGHHDATVYGIGWEADYSNDSTIHQRSDVKSVCNDHPALLSFELGHIELGDERNLDGVPFDRIRKEIIAHYDRGGMVTLSWHLDNPLSGGTSWVADSLKDVFRPWHEHTGSWFWWGQAHCTADQYKALWQMTIQRLKEHEVVNALYAYSPGTEPDGDETKYLERYPGDDIIDLMGLDCYCFAPDADTVKIANYAAQLDRNLEMVCRVAQQHQKAAALTETGYECIKTPNWWTTTLAPVLAKHPICYVLVWRNAHDKPGHYFAPYPGQQSTSDFVKFYNDPKTLFLHDVNGLYL